jgi:hypothetical protein
VPTDRLSTGTRSTPAISVQVFADPSAVPRPCNWFPRLGRVCPTNHQRGSARGPPPGGARSAERARRTDSVADQRGGYACAPPGRCADAASAGGSGHGYRRGRALGRSSRGTRASLSDQGRRTADSWRSARDSTPARASSARPPAAADPGSTEPGAADAHVPGPGNGNGPGPRRSTPDHAVGRCGAAPG